MLHGLYCYDMSACLFQSRYCNCAGHCLGYDCHLVDEAFAVTELLNHKEHVADVNVDTTLEVVVKVDVAAE